MREIAILGGGIASLAAAYELTSEPGWRDRYAITVHQLGFRLGGKGASGVDTARHDRVEEHGLHVWMGFYHNAFSLMRGCYAELGRAPGEPLATIDEAFRPHDFVTWEEEVRGAYRHWLGPFAPNGGVPGLGGPPPEPWDYVRMLLPRFLRSWYHMKEIPSVGALLKGALVEWAIASVHIAYHATNATLAALGSRLLEPLRALRDRAYEALSQRFDEDDDARHVWVGMDLIYVLTRGMIADRVVTEGFDAIDAHDLTAWLRRHGATDLLLRSGLVRTLYEFVFAYERGDPSRPSLAAGTMLRVVLRMLFAYEGSIFYKMAAGMGETVFAPLYLVLRARGVRFAFFHRVEALSLAADGATIERIRIGVQATPRAGAYEPLIDVRGLPCWPTAPLHAQLVEGEAMQARALDLESPWSGHADVGSLDLERGRDFDEVILGIPVGALAPVCRELTARLPAWRAMVGGLATVPTQALQLWMKPDLAGLGWREPPPLLTGYAFPYSTWADFSHVLPREGWASAEGFAPPRSLAYLCGPLPEPAPPRGDDDASYPARATAEAKRQALAWLDERAAHLWPRAVDAGGRFDHGVTVDPLERTGAARFEAQHCRANVSPSDRYVLSLPGTLPSRMRAGGSGIANLKLAGDWVRTGVNLGCIESAVMSGLQAARAVSGRARAIPGEGDFERRPRGPARGSGAR